MRAEPEPSDRGAAATSAPRPGTPQRERRENRSQKRVRPSVVYGGVTYCSQTPLAPLFRIAPIYWNVYLVWSESGRREVQIQSAGFGLMIQELQAPPPALSTGLAGGEQALKYRKTLFPSFISF